MDNLYIIEEAYQLGMAQNRYEILSCLEFLKTKKIKNFMEIGTNEGGTFICWSRITGTEGIKISLDWAHGPWGTTNFDVDKRDLRLKEMGDEVYIINGDSHSLKTHRQIKNILGDKKLDFLFIDGDHSENGVKLDYFMYKEFVKNGGLIGFHDIKESEFHAKAACFVSNFWNDMDVNKYWFMSNNHWGGIGIIENQN